MYDFNLLVSHSWGTDSPARNEIKTMLKKIGDESPIIRRTLARGITGVKTNLDPRVAITALQNLHRADPTQFQFTLKWIPIDAWTTSEIDAIKSQVDKLKAQILSGERWRLTVEKRRFTKYHKMEIIREVAELINEKVDLKRPDKILILQIIGNETGIAILRPEEIFSTVRLPIP